MKTSKEIQDHIDLINRVIPNLAQELRPELEQEVVRLQDQLTKRAEAMKTQEMNKEMLIEIINEATEAAQAEAYRYFHEVMEGEDRGSCGFAWTIIAEYQGKKITGNTKMGRLLKACGVGKDHVRRFQIWNPAKAGVQNIDTLEAGARAAAKVFQQYGFDSYMGSRLD